MNTEKRTLVLKGRYYRNIPVNSPGYEEEDLVLEVDKTSLVILHCWNIGCKENPVDVNYCVGMGFPEAIKESHRIIKKYIKPAMEIARKVKIIVSHVEHPLIYKRYVSKTEEKNIESSEFTPAVPGYKEKIIYRAHGLDYEKNPPYSTMDRVKDLKPKEGDVFVQSTEEFDRSLREKGIENLIYTGFATDMCILHSPGGILSMFNLGYRVYLIREATLGIEYPDTFKKRLSTKWAIRFFESHYGDTIGYNDFIKGCQKLVKRGGEKR